MDSVREHLRIVFVEDSVPDCELILREFKRAGFELEYRRVQTEAELKEVLLTFTPDVILSDFTMPTFSGAEAFSISRILAPETPFIFVSGTIGEERAVDAMKLGATDYVLKDRLKRLAPAVERALEEAQERVEHRVAQVALEESEGRFRSFMGYLPGRASITDVEGRYTYVNDNWLQAFGMEASDVLGRTHDEVWPPERAAKLKPVHKQVVDTVKPVRRVFKTGDTENDRWWLSHHFPILAGDGKTAMVGTVAIDITEQKIQEERIARLNRIYAVLSGINSAIVRIRDRQSLFDEACRIAVEHGNFGLAWIGTFDSTTLDVTPIAWAGLGTDEIKRSRSTTRSDVPLGQGLVGRAIRERKPAFDNDIASRPGVGGQRRRAALGLGYRSLIVLPLFEGDAVAGCLALFAREQGFFTEEELKLLAELAGDISFALEHISKEEKLNHLAYYDGLTDLPNRTLFNERLGHELRNAQREGRKVALLLGDIKRLRFINESYGRQTGDALIREIGIRFKRIWPNPEHVARIGADCFAGILLDVNGTAEIAHLIEGSVTKAFVAPLAIQDGEVSVSMTAGVALSPIDGEDIDTLFRNAEAALNKAKKGGDRYLFYQPAMNARVAETLSLENKLRKALDNEQFILHYQPKTVLETGALSGLEALIRWNDPETGLVPPAQFIPLLEETGMILEAGRWAITKALEDYRRWAAVGFEQSRVAVNVSAIQLRQKGFVDTVRQALEGRGESSGGLDLEITESLIMDDIEGNIAKLRAIREMGVTIAIDDFGTGYSSLGYLAKLPVNALKIDRSFIIGMADNPDNMSIISTIISLAHSLKLKVIAEGVETEEQLRLLTLLNCDEIQGYLISKPLPADQAFQFMSSDRC